MNEWVDDIYAASWKSIALTFGMEGLICRLLYVQLAMAHEEGRGEVGAQVRKRLSLSRYLCRTADSGQQTADN